MTGAKSHKLRFKTTSKPVQEDPSVLREGDKDAGGGSSQGRRDEGYTGNGKFRNRDDGPSRDRDRNRDWGRSGDRFRDRSADRSERGRDRNVGASRRRSRSRSPNLNRGREERDRANDRLGDDIVAGAGNPRPRYRDRDSDSGRWQGRDRDRDQGARGSWSYRDGDTGRNGERDALRGRDNAHSDRRDYRNDRRPQEDDRNRRFDGPRAKGTQQGHPFDSSSSSRGALGAPSFGAQKQQQQPMTFIIVTVNDRLGTKSRIPCLPSDTIADFKKLLAARIGRQPHEIMLKRQGERPFKDALTLEDYSISNGVQIDLELDTGD